MFVQIQGVLNSREFGESFMLRRTDVAVSGSEV
jgi:hypothetical protein